MKHEYDGKSISKFVSLKSNVQSKLDESSNEKSTNKAHTAFIEFQEFHGTLFQKKILRNKMRGIKSQNDNLGTYETNKISISCFDDKQYILKNGINTLAYGNKDIQKCSILTVLQTKATKITMKNGRIFFIIITEL